MKNNSHPTPIEIQKYLKGISYPATKDDLINCAAQNNAHQKIIDAIEQLAIEKYNSPTDVTKHMKDTVNLFKGEKVIKR